MTQAVSIANAKEIVTPTNTADTFSPKTEIAPTHKRYSNEINSSNGSTSRHKIDHQIYTPTQGVTPPVQAEDSELDLYKVFQRFYVERRVRNHSTGLGLSISPYPFETAAEKIESMVQSLSERFGIASQLDKYPHETTKYLYAFIMTW